MFVGPFVCSFAALSVFISNLRVLVRIKCSQKVVANVVQLVKPIQRNNEAYSKCSFPVFTHHRKQPSK